ncbi:MAG: serine/threonine-protein kinase [Telluria sp.]
MSTPESTAPGDDDRTRMMPLPGASADAAGPAALDAGNALAPGTRLGEFEILSVIGKGGFGIVYLAYDESLQREVAIKEYMPSSLAARAGGTRVQVRMQQHAEAFDAGLRSFINEARLLARFDHPALLKVYRFWEANGSAYMVMPYYRGLTLTQALRAMPGPPDEAWLLALLAPLLDALDTLHCAQCFHRDIAPDNIMMLADGRPLLLDFGAARRAIAGKVQHFTVILKPGYAPIEQYAELASLQQGPWTDIYALGAVVHHAITGRPPPASVARMVTDTRVPLATSAAGRYSDGFLRVIDRALAVRPEERPQSIGELRALLGLEAAAARDPAPGTRQPDAPRPPRRRLLAVAGGLGLALALAATWWLVPGTAERPVAPHQPAPAPATPAPAPRLAPIDVLFQVAAASNRDHLVTVDLSAPRVRIGVDRLHFTVRSSRAGYVYLLMVGSDRTQFWLLFPNDVDQDNRIAAGGTLALPRRGWRMTAAGPPGTDQLLAIVSEAPRDFSAAGLKPNPPFAEFRLGEGAAIPGPPGEAAQRYAGTVRCPGPAGSACPRGYGAALFSIEEVAPR